MLWRTHVQPAVEVDAGVCEVPMHLPRIMMWC